MSVTALNVDDDASVTAAIAEILAEHGHIDVLVNNAGVAAGGSVEEVPMGHFRQVMETNFFGALRCIKAVTPSMRERQRGCIVNVTSVAGRVALPPQAAYAASKWALEALSECLGPRNEGVQRSGGHHRTRGHRHADFRQGEAAERG